MRSGAPPLPVSQWRELWNMCFCANAPLRTFGPRSVPVISSRWFADNGHSCVRNPIFLLFCLAHSYYVIYWLTSPAARTCVSAAGKFPAQCSSSVCSEIIHPAFSTSWKTYWAGMLRSSKTPWCWTLLNGSSRLFSVRLCSKCLFSPLQPMLF